MKALIKLKPSISVIQDGIMEKYLTLRCDTELGFNYLIQSAPLISSEHISAGLIKNLIHASYHFPTWKLKRKALSFLAAKLNGKQLEIYVLSCMQQRALEAAFCLKALPSSMLIAKIDLMVTNYTNQFDSEEREIRVKAYQSFLALGPIPPLFPDNFLANFIKKLNQDNYYEIEGDLPKIIPFINRNDVEEVYKLFFLNASKMESYEKVIIAYESMILLAPKLSQNCILQIKDLFIKNLEHESLKARAFSGLTRIAHRFKDAEFYKIIAIIKEKGEIELYSYTFAKPCHLVNLITKETAENIAFILLKVLKSRVEEYHVDAYSGLIKILNNSYGSKALIRDLIANLIEILSEKYPHQIVILNELIMLSDLITAEEYKQISKLPARSFAMIGTKYLIGSKQNFFSEKLSSEEIQKNILSNSHQRISASI